MDVRARIAEANGKGGAPVPRGCIALSVVVALCLAVPHLARAGVGLGFNIGLDIPSGDATLGLGGVWHIALDYSPSTRLSLAAEVGTAANATDADRTVTVHGIPREVTLHAVSTAGLVARYGLRRYSPSPYLLLGADYYTSWDDLRETPQVRGTVTRAGLGLPIGAGILLHASSRWDFYGEGLYHVALGSNDDAGYAALQCGVRYRLGRRPSG